MSWFKRTNKKETADNTDKKKTTENKPYPFGHIYGETDLLDGSIGIIENYLTQHSDFNIDETTKKVKNSIYLSRVKTSDGRTYICINYPEDFKRMYMLSLYKDDTAESVLKNSAVMSFHHAERKDETHFYIVVASMAFGQMETDDEIKKRLTEERLKMYKQIIIEKYNAIIDNLDKRVIVESVPIDEMNNDDFIERDGLFDIIKGCL